MARPFGFTPVAGNGLDMFMSPEGEHPSQMAGTYMSSPLPIPGGISFNGAVNGDDDDEFAERTFVDRRDVALFPDHVKQEDEQRHLQNLEEDTCWTEQDLNTLQEGDRLGIGLRLQSYPIVDALDGNAEGGIRAPDDGIQYEIIRQLWVRCRYL